MRGCVYPYALVSALLRCKQASARRSECVCSTLLHYLLGTGVLPVCSAAVRQAHAARPAARRGSPLSPRCVGWPVSTRVLLPCLVYVEG